MSGLVISWARRVASATAAVSVPTRTAQAWHDNAASLGVTRSVPYLQSGSSIQLRRERPDTMLEFTMRRAQWNTARRNDIDLIGIDAARAQLSTARDVPSFGG